MPERIGSSHDLYLKMAEAKEKLVSALELYTELVTAKPSNHKENLCDLDPLFSRINEAIRMLTVSDKHIRPFYLKKLNELIKNGDIVKPETCLTCDSKKTYTIIGDIENPFTSYYFQCLSCFKQSNTRVTIFCRHCKKPFQVQKNRAQKTKFCSRDCVIKDGTSLRKRPKTPTVLHKIQCWFCLDTFLRPRKKRKAKFCSKTCYYSYRRCCC